MVAPKNPWVQELHAWDERIGADASITHVNGGKKQFPSASKVASNIPLPTKEQPFLVPMPRNGEFADQKPVVVNTDTHMWRSYRAMVSTDGVIPEGKKMSARPIPMIEVQAHLRKCMREKLRDQERRELAMSRVHELERAALAHRHAQHAKMEESFLRSRTVSLGFEGLRKPVTRSKPALPPLPPDEIQRSVSAALEPHTKPRELHPSQRTNGPPFGSMTPALGAPDGSIKRWVDKSLY